MIVSIMMENGNVKWFFIWVIKPIMFNFTTKWMKVDGNI